MFPEKSKIIFKGDCSDCGNEVIIDILPTSGGFGLLEALWLNGRKKNMSLNVRVAIK